MEYLFELIVRGGKKNEKNRNKNSRIKWKKSL